MTAPVPPYQGTYGDHPVARRTDPQTSHDAARSVVDRRKSQDEVYAIIKRLGGATDTEIALEAGRTGVLQSSSGLRTRRKELVDMGDVEDSGSTRLTVSRRRTIVWRVTVTP